MADYRLSNGKYVIRLVDGATVPFDTGNKDYQEYLAWLAAGNTPDPIPVIPQSTFLDTYDYFNRFTVDETNAIHQFAMTNPANASSLAIFNYIMLAAARGTVDLSSPIVSTGHALLVQLGLLTAERSAIILTP